MQSVLNYILILFIIVHVHVMRTQQVFSHVCEDMPKGQRMRSQTKKYDYFKEFSRCKWIQGSLKQTSNTPGLLCTSIKRLWKEKASLLKVFFRTLVAI